MALKERRKEVLDRVEKLVRTDIRYLLKGGFWLSIGQGVAMVSGLLLSIAFANLIPKEVFGTYKFILSLVAIIGAFTLTELKTALIRAVSQKREGSFTTAVITQAKWTIPVIILSLAVSLYYFVNGNNTLSVALLIATLFIPIELVTSLYAPYLEGRKKFKENTLFNTIRSIVPALGIGISLFFTQNVLIIVSLFFILTTLPRVIFFLHIRHKYKLHQETTKPDSMVSYSKHLSLMNILTIGATHADKILVFHFLGAVQLAIYAFAIAIPKQLRNVSKIVKTLSLPKFSNRPIKEIKKNLFGKLTLAALFGAVLAAIYIPIAPMIYSLLFPQYIESVIYSQFYALTMLFIPNALMIQLLVGQERKKELYIIRTTVPIVRLLLFALLIPLFGIMGVISALLIAHVTASVMLAVSIIRMR